MSLEDHLHSVLDACDTRQLNKYLTEDESMNTLVENLEQIHVYKNEKNELEIKNRQLAESNLSKKDTIEDLKQQLLNAITELEQAKDDYFKLLTSHNQTADSSDMPLEGIYTVLQTSATKNEEETDQQAEDFFLNESKVYTDEELNQFQKYFLENRANAHMKKIKAEKLKELLGTYN